MSSTWQSFKLTPQDPLFFRDGKPSTIGDDHYLRSLFPPFPSTLYGAVRTRRLIDTEVDLDRLSQDTWSTLPGHLRAEVGEWGCFGSLQMRGPWLIEGNDICLPAPFDLALVAGVPAEPPQVKEVLRYRPLSADSGNRGGWSHPLALMAPFRSEAGSWQPVNPVDIDLMTSTGWFLRPAGIGRWLRGDCPLPEDLVHRSQLWQDEIRTGVGLRQGVRSAQESMLYTFGLIRLQRRVALGFETAGTGLQSDGLLQLGGDRRVVSLGPGPEFPTAALPPPARSVRLVIAFVSPALSESGTYPPGFAADQLEGSIAGFPCRLVAGALPGPVCLGGWDMARGFAKPLRRAIPAGSVFVFEVPEGNAGELSAQIHGTCLCDNHGENLSAQGFGLVIAGVDTSLEE